MTGEVWRVVPSLPQFLASSEGRVMVAPHIGKMPNGSPRQYGGQPHFGVWNKLDARFVLFQGGKTYKVHRLICEAFHGPPPDGQNVCLHIDENSANNRADNLKWGTQKENLNAPSFIAYCEERIGENSPWVKGRKKAAAA